MKGTPSEDNQKGCTVYPPLERANTPKTATKKRIGPRAPVVPPR